MHEQNNADVVVIATDGKDKCSTMQFGNIGRHNVAYLLGTWVMLTEKSFAHAHRTPPDQFAVLPYCCWQAREIIADHQTLLVLPEGPLPTWIKW